MAGLFHASSKVLTAEVVRKELAIRRRLPCKGAMEAAFDRAEVSLREVEARPARADERRRWDALMAARHYPGSGSSRGADCGTWRCGGGIGWRWRAGSRAPSSARRGTAGWAGTARCGSGGCAYRQQHAVPDSARGAGDEEPGLADAGAEPAAAECGLAGGARPRAGAGGDVRGSVAVLGWLPRKSRGRNRDRRHEANRQARSWNRRHSTKEAVRRPRRVEWWPYGVFTANNFN